MSSAATVTYRKRRFSSFVMLVLAVALGIGGYVLTDLNQFGKLADLWFVGPAIWALLALVAWAVVAWRLPYADPLLLPSAVLLNGIGIAMIHRLDLATDPPMKSAELQLMWAFASVVAFCVVVFWPRPLQTPALHLRVVRPGPHLPAHAVAARDRFREPRRPSDRAACSASSLRGGQDRAVGRVRVLPCREKDVLAQAGGDPGSTCPAPGSRADPRHVDGQPDRPVFQKDLGTTLLFFGLFVAMLYIATERPSWAILRVDAGSDGCGRLLPVRPREGAFQCVAQPVRGLRPQLPVINAQYGFAFAGCRHRVGGRRPTSHPAGQERIHAAALGEELGLFGLVAILVVFLIIPRGFCARPWPPRTRSALLAAGSFVFAPRCSSSSVG